MDVKCGGEDCTLDKNKLANPPTFGTHSTKSNVNWFNMLSLE